MNELLLPGEANEILTRELIKQTQLNFLAIGKLLLESKEKAYWSATWGSFSDYVESLGISKSPGYNMIAVYEFLLSGKLTEPDILEIGIAKMPLLISAGKQGKLTDDMIALAKHAPVRDFKESLGYKITENDCGYFIICPRCSQEIRGAQWKKDYRDFVPAPP